MTNEPLSECPFCQGYGELPGNPATNTFPTCSMCEGTGLSEEEISLIDNNLNYPEDDNLFYQPDLPGLDEIFREELER